MDRDSSNHLHPQPSKHLKGVPVMIRVPTHLDVKIVEIDHWAPSKSGHLTMIPTTVPCREIATSFVETEKMFLVDPKRPASGTGVFGFTFGAEDGTDAGKGYLSGVEYKAEDTTLKDTAGLLANIKNTLGTLTSNEGDKETTGLITTQNTIAYQRFDINSPYFEQEVSDFVSSYMNLTQTVQTIN